MTSSLVGSEMCIRDSYIAWQLVCNRDVLSEASRSLFPQDISSTNILSLIHILTLPTICSV
eukprot:5775937-Prorocentrum_lima.AAC.1